MVNTEKQKAVAAQKQLLAEKEIGDKIKHCFNLTPQQQTSYLANEALERKEKERKNNLEKEKSNQAKWNALPVKDKVAKTAIQVLELPIQVVQAICSQEPLIKW